MRAAAARPAGAAAAAALALVLAAPETARAQDDGEADAPSGPTLGGPVWVLEELDGEAYEAEARVMFTTDADGGALVRGGGPCNTFRGIYVVEAPTGGLFDAGPFATTRRACPRMEAETAFLSALEAASEARFENGRLVLGGFGPRMEFRAEAPPPED